MIKNVITCIVAILIFIGFGLLENHIVSRSFSEFDKHLEILELKASDSIATENDATTVKFFWQKQKETLHMFIPHVEIKEVDLWVSEAVSLIYENKFAEALQKIEVLRTLCIQIPSTFKLRIENVL